MRMLTSTTSVGVCRVGRIRLCGNQPVAPAAHFSAAPHLPPRRAPAPARLRSPAGSCGDRGSRLERPSKDRRVETHRRVVADAMYAAGTSQHSSHTPLEKNKAGNASRSDAVTGDRIESPAAKDSTSFCVARRRQSCPRRPRTGARRRASYFVVSLGRIDGVMAAGSRRRALPGSTAFGGYPLLSGCSVLSEPKLCRGAQAVARQQFYGNDEWPDERQDDSGGTCRIS